MPADVFNDWIQTCLWKLSNEMVTFFLVLNEEITKSNRNSSDVFSKNLFLPCCRLSENLCI